MTDQILYTSDGTNLIIVGSNSTSYRAVSGGANSFVANSTGVYLSQASGAVPLFANGSAGTNGYVLTTNSAGSPYWAVSSSGLTGAQIAANNWTFTNNISFANTITANGGVGIATYVLTSGGAGQNVYWAVAGGGGGGSVNTANQYIFTNTITFQANVLVGGNSTSQIIVGNSTQNSVIGYNSTDFSPAEFAANANNFIAVYVRNANTGNNASADFSVYNDSFSGTADKWIDIGINGSGFNQSTWTINGANDTYVFAGNSNLSVGANGTNYVNFFTGGTLAANERMRIAANGFITVANVISVNTFFTNVFSAGVGTITTAGTTTTFNNLTQYYQHVVGSTTQTIRLPDATTLANGGTYIIDNDSTANITINDSAGGFLATALPGMGIYAWSYSNATATGNWGTYTWVPSGLMANNTNIVGTGQQNTTITANGYVTTFDYNGNILAQSLIQNRYSGQMYAVQSGFALT